MTMRSKLGASGRASPRVPPAALSPSALCDDNPENVDSTTAAPGVSGNVSRCDHVHAHGDLIGGSLHALAIANGAAGFMSGADKNQVDKYGWGIINAETQAIFNAMDDRPPVFLGQAMDGLVTWLKDSGWWDEIGSLLVPVLHTEQASLLDWKNPGVSYTNPKPLVFTPFQGFQGDATANGEIVSSVDQPDVPGYTLNQANIFAWSEGGTTVGAPSYTSSTSQFLIVPRNGAGNFVGRLNTSGAVANFGAVANQNGLRQLIRVDGTNVSGYNQGVLAATVAQATTAVPTGRFSLVESSDGRLIAAGAGGLVTALPSDLHAALVDFYDQIGTVHS